MGALVLLLLSVTRQARLQAAREAAAKDAEKQSSIAAEMEMVQWRVEQLKNSRKATEAQLAEARLVLGHIEDHGRRLRDQFQDLSRQAKKAADEGLKPGRFVAAGEEELRQVEGQIAEAQQRLAQAQQAAANRPKSYAIVPYDGPNRTRRRPIYIECRGDAVVLQPENIVFTEADFDEPLGPGNPLAAAIRAAREQMLLQGSVDPQNAGEPYPLLLVRPAGIPAYECALAAMKSWGSEFGYELINEDWQLKYPPPDPNLARSVAQAVFLARQEHARLIAAAPSKYGKRPRLGSYRSPTGGEAGEQGRGRGGRKPRLLFFQAGRPLCPATAGGGSSATGRSGRRQRQWRRQRRQRQVAAAVAAARRRQRRQRFRRRRRVRRQQSLRIASRSRAWPVHRPCSRRNGNGSGMVQETEWAAPGSGVAGGMAGSPAMLPGGTETVRGMVRETEWAALRDPASQAAWPVHRACFPVEQETVRGMVPEMERVALRDPASAGGMAGSPTMPPGGTEMAGKLASPAARPAQPT